MSTPLIIDQLLGDARRAALAGGLHRVCRLFIGLGPDGDVDPDELEIELRTRFRGPLFQGCEIDFETDPVGSVESPVRLTSIEGFVTAEPADGDPGDDELETDSRDSELAFRRLR